MECGNHYAFNFSGCLVLIPNRLGDPTITAGRREKPSPSTVRQIRGHDSSLTTQIPQFSLQKLKEFTLEGNYSIHRNFYKISTINWVIISYHYWVTS